MNVYRDKEDLAEAAARDFTDRAREAIETNGRFTVALAGWSTPKATYEALARDHAEKIDWGRLHVFFGGERTVPRTMRTPTTGWRTRRYSLTCPSGASTVCAASCRRRRAPPCTRS